MHRLFGFLACAGLLTHLGCQECCTDSDCAIAGTGDLCVEGSCAAGDPPIEANDECDGDDDCDGDQICVQGSCAFAPSCLRLQRSFVARLNDEPELGTVVATTSGCEVTFTYDFPSGLSSSATVERIERDGAFTGAVGLRTATGAFDPARRTGSFGVAIDDDIVFGTDSYVCVVDDDCARQLFENCVLGDDGAVGVCR